VQDTLPHLIETIKAGDPPTLLKRVQLVGVRVEHHRGHGPRIAALRATELRAATDQTT
jgi:hypothetical protein